MRTGARTGAGRDAAGIHEAIERFLAASRQPFLLEPGEQMLALTPGCYALELKNGRVTIEAWNDERNLVRRVTDIAEARRGRMELTTERFARRPGQLFLLDLARPEAQEAARHGGKLVFRERFRLALLRRYPGWKLAEVSAERDLTHSLSPAYPRALLRRGKSGIAAIAAPPDSIDPPAALSFGLIWLDYLRRRDRQLAIELLVLLLPAGQERATCHRTLYLNPDTVRTELVVYDEQDFTGLVDPRDAGNLDTKLEVCRQPDGRARAWLERLQSLPGVEAIEHSSGAVSLSVRGLEVARSAGGELLFGLHQRAALRDYNFHEVEQLCAELAAARSPHCEDPASSLFRSDPESWLASQVRAHLGTLDASLEPKPVYDEVPACAGAQRGIMDLLAIDHHGRLAVLELKASADIHLPLQALDYWMRVRWHLDRSEFTTNGYFPGIALRKDPPRLLLVSPALEFHPTTETILQFFSPEVDVERIGLGSGWRGELEVMFRLRGAERPHE